MWSWHWLTITPIYLSTNFELSLIYSYSLYLANIIKIFSEKEYIYNIDYRLKLNTFYSLKVNMLDFRNIYLIDILHIFLSSGLPGDIL